MPTIRDVAKQAGVSVSTVSYTLSGSRPISAETQMRIRVAMEELGFQPHALARGLAQRRSRILALLYPPVSGALGATELSFVTSASHAARTHGYSLLLSTFERDDLVSLRDLTQQGLVDGIIVMEIRLVDARVELLRQANFPFSIIGRLATNDGLNFVDIDFEQTVGEPIGHLVSLGHERIAYCNFSSEVVETGFGPAVRSREAFGAATGRHGVSGYNAPCESSPRAGYEWMRAALTADPRLTAVLTQNEQAVPGILQALRDAERRVAEDFSLILTSGSGVAEMFAPALTGMELPSADLGRLGAEILISQLDGQKPESIQKLLPSRLVVRQSTGPRA